MTDAMAELLMTVKSNLPNASKLEETRRYGPGDIITVQEDAWPWSAAELTNPDWRIIQAKGMTVSEGESLISPEKNPLDTKAQRWKRLRKLDLAHVLIGPGKFKNFLGDDTRVVPIFNFNAQQAVLISNITVIKPDADIYVIS